MKCYFHENENAVAACQSCGKSLCKSCAAKNTPCMCSECIVIQKSNANSQKNQKKKDALIDTNAELIVAIIKGLVCAVVFGFIFGSTSTDTSDAGMGMLFFFLPFGWAVITYLESWLPSFFMSGPIFLVYLIFKITFSVALGIPCFIFQVVKYILKTFVALRR